MMPTIEMKFNLRFCNIGIPLKPGSVLVTLMDREGRLFLDYGHVIDIRRKGGVNCTIGLIGVVNARHEVTFLISKIEPCERDFDAIKRERQERRRKKRIRQLAEKERQTIAQQATHISNLDALIDDCN